MHAFRVGTLLWLGTCLLTALGAGALAQTPQLRAKTHLEDIEHSLFELVNDERARQGLALVEAEPVLAEVAQNHSADMLEREFFDHVNLDGRGPNERVSRAHRTLVGEVAENIWSGIRSRDLRADSVAREIMDGLMNSPGHRLNILTPEMTHMGLGVYSALGRAVLTDEIAVTQLFAAVRGYLEDSVPESLSRNQVVRFRLRDLEGGRANARYFDLWSIDDRLAVIGPASLLQTRIEAPPGAYQLRILYDTEVTGRLDAISGPYLTIR